MRHAIKGVQHVVFLGVPEYPSFYTDHVDRLEPAEDEEASCCCQLLFTKFDGLSLERIVGSDNCTRMIKGEKSTYTLTAGR
jgi:U3 small nucleolar RNA-associated protein 25